MVSSILLLMAPGTCPPASPVPVPGSGPAAVAIATPVFSGTRPGGR